MGGDFRPVPDRHPARGHPDALLPEIPRARADVWRGEGVGGTGAAGFLQRYGPWAVIAGGSEGIGAEFARQLAARGLSLVLAARRREPLSELAARISSQFHVETRTVALDFAERGAVQALCDATADIDVGLLVCSAAASPLGDFLDLPREDHARLVDLNCRAPALLAWEFGRRMIGRAPAGSRGGIIVLSSMAGFQGTGFVAHYAASKAYARVLAEGLWNELRPRGVDAIACCPGLVRTPTLEAGRPAHPFWLASPLMETEPVVAQTLRALGRRPVVVPGMANRISLWITAHLMPRRAAITMSSAGTRAMYPDQGRD